MASCKLSIIAAIDEKRGLGKNNQLLFHLPPDLKRFRKTTWGCPVIMGRKTFESIGRPLSGRINIVVSRRKDYQVKGGFVLSSLKTAIAFAQKQKPKEIFIIGGGQIYQQAIKQADKLYLTIVKGDFQADVFFPAYQRLFKPVKKSGWKKYQQYQYCFVDLSKKKQ